MAINLEECGVYLGPEDRPPKDGTRDGGLSPGEFFGGEGRCWALRRTQEPTGSPLINPHTPGIVDHIRYISLRIIRNYR